MRDKMSKKKGQTIIEMLVAVGIIVVALTALVAATITAVRNAKFSQNTALATKFAQEGMEATRSIRDRSWTELQNGNHGLSWDVTQWSFSGFSDTPALGFTRVVNVADSGSDKKLITTTVSWTDSSGTGTHESKQVSYLTKWR